MTYQFRKLESSSDACVTRLHAIVGNGYNDAEFLDKLADTTQQKIKYPETQTF